MRETGQSGDLWEQARRQFAHSVDVTTLTRAEWRAVCTAKERPAMQNLLVRLAEAAQTASQTERLGLYKAAYAVLPLHGAELKDFAELLLEEQPPSPEWADALMLALAEQSQSNGRLIAPLLSALGGLYRARKETLQEQRCADWIAFHVRMLGFQPGWLNPSPA